MDQEEIYKEANKLLADLSVLPSGMISVGDFLFLTNHCRWSREGLRTVTHFEIPDLMTLHEIHQRYFDMSFE